MRTNFIDTSPSKPQGSLVLLVDSQKRSLHTSDSFMFGTPSILIENFQRKIDHYVGRCFQPIIYLFFLEIICKVTLNRQT